MALAPCASEPCPLWLPLRWQTNLSQFSASTGLEPKGLDSVNDSRKQAFLRQGTAGPGLAGSLLILWSAAPEISTMPRKAGKRVPMSCKGTLLTSLPIGPIDLPGMPHVARNMAWSPFLHRPAEQRFLLCGAVVQLCGSLLGRRLCCGNLVTSMSRKIQEVKYGCIQQQTALREGYVHASATLRAATQNVAVQP